MIVLDTDIVTLVSYGKNDKLRNRIAAVGEEETLAVTVTTRMEVLQGRYASIKNAANPEELLKAMQRFRESEELLGSFHLLEVDAGAADRFAELTRQKPKSKKAPQLKRGDLLIACIALANNALLVTRNVKDFKEVAGLRVENWAD
jgi:predicted nucleic acid-binding protein